MFLDTLPKDIKYSIALNLSLIDIHNLVCCNKIMARMSNDDSFWMRKLKHDFPQVDISKSDKTSFKAQYLKFGFGNKLWLQKHHKKRVLFKGVSKLVEDRTNIFWIDLFSNLWCYILHRNFIRDPLISRGQNIIKDAYGGERIKLLAQVKDACPALNWILDLNGNLYVYDYNDRQLKASGVRAIGCHKGLGYYVLTNGDLYVRSSEDYDNDIFISQHVVDVAISSEMHVYYVTGAGSIWKWYKVYGVLKSPGSKLMTDGWVNKQLILSGVKNLAWCKKLMFIDQKNKLYSFDETKNECLLVVEPDVNRIFGGVVGMFIDCKQNLWCQWLSAFWLETSHVSDACAVDNHFIAYVKKFGSSVLDQMQSELW